LKKPRPQDLTKTLAAVNPPPALALRVGLGAKALRHCLSQPLHHFVTAPSVRPPSEPHLDRRNPPWVCLTFRDDRWRARS